MRPVVNTLREAGIEVHVAGCADAVTRDHEVFDQGRAVGLLLHSTC